MPNYNKALPYIDVHAAVTWQCLSKFILITKTKPSILILHMLCNYVKVFARRASGSRRICLSLYGKKNIETAQPAWSIFHSHLKAYELPIGEQ